MGMAFAMQPDCFLPRANSAERNRAPLRYSLQLEAKSFTDFKNTPIQPIDLALDQDRIVRAPHQPLHATVALGSRRGMIIGPDMRLSRDRNDGIFDRARTFQK
jgi:hypothetical protein